MYQSILGIVKDKVCRHHVVLIVITC